MQFSSRQASLHSIMPEWTLKDDQPQTPIPEGLIVSFTHLAIVSWPFRPREAKRPRAAQAPGRCLHMLRSRTVVLRSPLREIVRDADCKD